MWSRFGYTAYLSAETGKIDLMPRARVCSNGRPYTRKPLELFPWEIQEDDDSPRHHIAIAIANSTEWPI
jgi:hypothetical protein